VLGTATDLVPRGQPIWIARTLSCDVSYVGAAAVRVTDSVERVAVTLEILADAPEGLGVTEVAERLGVHKATASRLLGTLARRRLVERDLGTRRYRVGTALVSLAGSAVTRLPVISQARPELEQLTRRSSETANLAVLDGLHVVYVDQVTPVQTVVMASWVGRRSPAHASSSGKVLLAFGDPADVDALLSRPLEALTEKTLTDPVQVRATIERVRERGYARSSGELEDGLVSIAAPVLVDSTAVAAVSLSGPSFRITPRDQPNLTRLVVDTATAISHRIAGRSLRGS
jgi:DNA-binding IclR family transcriptional regulator